MEFSLHKVTKVCHVDIRYKQPTHYTVLKQTRKDILMTQYKLPCYNSPCAWIQRSEFFGDLRLNCSPVSCDRTGHCHVTVVPS